MVVYRNVKWVGVPYGPFLKRPFAGRHAAVLGHAATRAGVPVAGVIAVPAVVLPTAAAACRQHRRKWWKLENYWGDTKPNSKAGAIDTHKHPLKPKSLPFKVGRAWNREIDAFIVSRLGTRE